jgi:hypothetical protein
MENCVGIANISSPEKPKSSSKYASSSKSANAARGSSKGAGVGYL